MAFWNKKKPEPASGPEPDTEPLRKNAELVQKMIDDLSGAGQYNAAALEWLDGFIQRMKASPDFQELESRRRLLDMFGCYLGECCIRAYGGSWAPVGGKGGSWQVVYDAKNSANPLDRPWKCYDEGLDASLKSFFEVLGEIRANPDRWQAPR